ncbi:thiamine pyrophosphate-binding protein [Streptomyces sp. PA03-5A]|nr:thiamine pyrophosphate-binding protein [Streptomyces sp. PA03-5A]
MTTALRALLEILADEGVDRVFGNPGTTELPFLEALSGPGPSPEYVLGVQEGSVVAMADGYARATRRPAFASLHIAAGTANGLIGMLNARRSRTPLVVMAGQQDRRHLLQDPMLAGDLVALASGAAKRAEEVHRPEDLPFVLRRAFALARQPPQGPVFVSVPMDVLEDAAPVEVPARSPLAPPGPAGGLDRAAALLAAAGRPAVVAGDGVGRDGAVGALVRVAEALGAVTYHQPMNDHLDFPGSHPLYAGPLPPVNARIHERLKGHDALLIAGCRAFTPHHYTPGPPVPAHLTVVQIDTDPAEPGRNFPVALGLTGPLDSSLAALAGHLARLVPEDTARERIREAGARHAEARDRLDLRARSAGRRAPVDPLAAAHALATALPEEAVLVEESITVGVHLRGVLRRDRPGGFVHTVGGGLGWGIGAAVGHRLGAPGRPVVAVLGDGCAMFGLQGLWSAAHHRVPVLFVVMANGEYRTLKDTLDTRGGSPSVPHPGLDLGELDWRLAARFFGIPAVRADGTEELARTVAAVGGLDGPLLVEVPLRGHS